MTMRIYVGTYSKYNSGSIAGAWLDLEDYSDKDEFYEACAALHSDEEDPEYMFQDYEGIPKSMISECSVDAEVWDVLQAMEKHDEDSVMAYIECFGSWDESDYQDRYRGQYDSWEDMAEQLLEETGELDAIPENLRYYFDYEKYARDLNYSGDFTEHDGHFFWNH